MKDDVIATLYATAIRRVFAYLAVFGFGAILVLVAFVQPPALGWQLFLLALGGGALTMAELLRRASLLGLELTEHVLRDTSGRELARLDQIVSVDRGAFAFKPSNGFVLHLNTRTPRFWAPGLWWRFGSRVGVGGVTPAGPAKYMAEQIALRISKF